MAMNGYGILIQAATPMRSEASHRAEMVSQLLFGESFRLIEQHDEWYYIATLHDGYEGWIAMQSAQLTEEPPHPTLQLSHRVSSLVATAQQQGSAATILLPMGSLLANFDDEQRTFTLGDNTYRLLVGDVQMPHYTTAQAIIACAKSCLHTPYLWGGRTTMGIDCSGFVQLCFALHGIPLLRDAKQQAEQGVAVASIDEVAMGDIALFSNSKGAVTHVGIVIDKETIIHASGSVRIDTLDAKGIYNREKKEYTHQLNSIRRVI